MTQLALGGLRLHTDAAGLVHWGHLGVASACTGMGPEQFIAATDFTAFPHVSVYGTAANALLLVRLYERNLLRTESLPVRVLPPTAAAGPTETVLRLWREEQLTSWRPLGQGDYTSYAMMHEWQQRRQLTDKLLRLLQAHPAWPAASFVRTVDPYLLCRLLCLIGNPHWFRHPQRPRRRSRLFAWLGLTPANLQALDQAGAARGRHAARARLVVRAWQGQTVAVPGDDVTCFPWRILARARTRTQGLLQATKRWLQLVCTYWEDRLTCSTRPVREPGFGAQLLLREDELVAFRQHVQGAVK